MIWPIPRWRILIRPPPPYQEEAYRQTRQTEHRAYSRRRHHRLPPPPPPPRGTSMPGHRRSGRRRPRRTPPRARSSAPHSTARGLTRRPHGRVRRSRPSQDDRGPPVDFTAALGATRPHLRTSRPRTTSTTLSRRSRLLSGQPPGHPQRPRGHHDGLTARYDGQDPLTTVAIAEAPAVDRLDAHDGPQGLARWPQGRPR